MSHDILNPSETNIFAISVIIPTYNREKYIGECLDSLLEQSFQDFEVIVIDDCSIDNTVRVVESYSDKFGERLRIAKMEKNSGHPGEPRNKGISIARGEYIYCLDSDDTVTKTALEEMYTLGKEYDADVVYCEKYYMSEGIGQEFKNNIHLAKSRMQQPPFVDKPTLETDDLGERVETLLAGNYWMTVWLKLVKRELLTENNIQFPPLIGTEDDIWSTKVFLCSKRFLRVPNVCFIRRIHTEGISFSKYTTPEHLQRWLDVIIRSLKDLDNFMAGIEFFRENPQQRYKVLERSTNASLGNAFSEYIDESAVDLHNIFQERFGSYLGNDSVLISCLCAHVATQKRNIRNEQGSEQQFKQRVAEQESTIKHLRAKLDSMLFLPALGSDTPAISVIIPMYNMERYIGECLDSLLIQTFQDFEVIVVDDCSTDNSFFAVKNYSTRFNGRLKVTKTEENSGGGGVPRNVGLSLARGEYILFVDSDDFILGNTLEILYKAAKEYNADVVYTSAYYLLHRLNEIRVMRDGKGAQLLKEHLEDEPVLTVNEPHKLLRQLVFERAFNFAVMHFVRRDLLLQNKITFTKIFNGEDHLWVIQVCCHAERFLRVSTPFYFYRRYDAESISVKERLPSEQVSHWLSGFATWMKLLNELASKEQILTDTPAYCFAAAERNFEWCLNRTSNSRDKLSSENIYGILCNEFTDDPDGLTLSYLLSVIDQRGKDALELKQQIDEQNTKFLNLIADITARIDVELVPKIFGGDFQILSVSDDKANIQKPDWFQKNGIGYQIESHARKMDIVAKTTAAGKIRLNLRGLDVRSPEDKSKRVPHWIDYTSLVVNGKRVINTCVPTWHSKTYRYETAVSAGQEINIQVEWFPHKSGT